ncbi:MAG: restriction endonuclease [Candidatus Brocadia sp. BL1]|nr:MAG: restriction endonuclease [Candidatus Brocadia sp. BL1]
MFMAGPQFIKYFPRVISALKDLGNSGTPPEVRELIAKNLQLSDEELDEQLNSGTSRLDNQVAWAKFYLAKAGYIDASKRGVWSLTEKGLNANITDKKALKICQGVQKQFKNKTASTEENLTQAIEETIAPADTSLTTSRDYRTELLDIIRSLSPAGFEKLCQRLLRESGFQQVEVTGRSGDGGIDGKGLLQINPLLSMQVVFQSKRYQANTAVTVSQIRDLRGAMAGRTDKGIFITTSTFTADARKEALREGVPPIELVDAQKLVTMFEELELGLTTKTAYDVDRKFFEEFT